MVESRVEVDVQREGEARVAAQPVRARGRRWLLVGMAAIGFISLASLLSWGLTRTGQPSSTSVQGVGEPARGFTLPGLNGGQVALAKPPGQPAFVYFWASWCVPCRDEAPMVESLWREYGTKVVFVGVNMQDTEANAQAFAREFNLTFPLARDTDGRVYVDYGVYGVPESFFVDSAGVVTHRWIGAVNAEDLRAVLEEATAG
jgi:cytochrome c biogenesis protein CcmG/thiol:disulfide interchange protein DsbE